MTTPDRDPEKAYIAECDTPGCDDADIPLMLSIEETERLRRRGHVSITCKWCFKPRRIAYHD